MGFGHAGSTLSMAQQCRVVLDGRQDGGFNRWQRWQARACSMVVCTWSVVQSNLVRGDYFVHWTEYCEHVNKLRVPIKRT